ncbi:hypothetical protein FGIG_07303 [Fasciola gigantica]|uniref:Rapamycin-insensitive companion of mTOR N-terminal domain-containing protein n=1 Tax=Fasciola gigantica TaxID=46835 RepID=A0A504Y7K2_FASGI|nr:hypothetical protein FGIG_07303 [Fasciola gigantica]
MGLPCFETFPRAASPDRIRELLGVRPVLPSSSDPRHSLDIIDDTVSAAPSPPGCLTSSSLVSGVGERQLFLRLAYHLVRVAPHLLPYSIIQALAAPCLRAGRFQAAGGVSIDPLGRPPDALHRFPAPEAARPVALGMLPRHLAAGCDQIRIPSENETNPITSDVALRTCLLILAELVILAPEHVAMISDIKATAVSPLECESRNSTQLDDPSTLKRKDSVIVQALMSAFASCSTMDCIHPTRIQEAVLLALLSLLNHTDTARFFPVTQIAKFFVPFTSAVANNFSPRTMFDTYPTYMSCAKTCLTMMFRSWSGLFYFLHDGLPCLQTLMYTLAVSSEMRNQILDLLFGLFPDLPKPHPSTKDIDPAILGLSEALANCAPTTLPVVQVNLPCSADGHSMSTRFRSGSRVDRTHGPSVLVRRRSPPTAWDIQGGFVAAEGLRVFPRPASVSPGLDLMDSYSALLLATLIQAGLYEGLIGAISDSNQVVSVRAGLLLGLLAYRASTLLPHNHPAAQRLHHCGLLRSGSGVNQLSVVWLERVHRVMRAHDLRHARPASLVLAPIHSPFLECLARQSRTTPTQSNILDDVLPSADNANPNRKDPCEQLSNVLTETCDRFLHRLMDFFTPTFTGNSKSTDRLVATSGRSSSIPNTFPAKKSHVKEPVGANKNFNHNTGTFTTSAALFQPKDQVGSLTRGPRSLTALAATYGTTESLVSSAFPSTDVSSTSTNLASLPFTWPHSSAAGVLIAGLIPHLALYPQNSEPGQLLSRFLSATQETFERSLPPVTDSATADTDSSSSWDADQTALFSATQLAESCSGLIILALGRLTSSDAGESRLEGSELCATFHRILLPTGSDVRTGQKTSLLHAKGEILSRHCKILLSSLDFTRPGRLGHQLLTAAVNGATKYFNVAYAREVDSRLWSLFTGPIGNSTGKSWNLWTMGTNQNGTHQLYSMPLFACFARHFARTSAPMDADSDAEPDMVSDTYLQNPPGLHCNQRDVFHFDETVSPCVGVSDSVTPSDVYLPPALVSNHSGTWTGEVVGNYWSCPLPRHPYGCLAEHTAGMELMLERGDLDTLIHTLQAAEFYWTTPPPASAPNLRSTGPNFAPSAKTTRPSIMEVKGALWALAHVGSATCGQAWMAKQPSLISLYIQIATEGRCMGLRALRFSEPGNMAFPLGPIACPESDDSDSRDSFAHSTSLRRAICLPADVQILGHLADGKLYSITGTNNVVFEMPTGADIATADANSDPLLAVAHRLSFVHIAAAAQKTLHKCEATDLSNSQSENSTNSASMYAPGYGAEVSVNSSTSKCVKKGEKSCSIHSNPQLMNNGHSSEVYVPPPRVICSSANPHTDEIQLNGCQLRSRPHPTELMNLDSVSVPFDHYCLSPKCKQHSFRSQPDRSRWFSQLMDVITGLLANVLSVNHELALNQLVEAARTAQRTEDSTLPELPELEESHPSRTGRLFDACVYTEVANLLQDYSFSLEARSKIQSAFLNLDLYGLFPDTNQAVAILERYVADFEPVSVVFNNN